MSEKHIPAFREPIAVSNFDNIFHPEPKLHEFENDKRFVVRKADEDMFAPDQYTTPEEMGEVLKGLFKELRDTYGIETPVHFVVANDENSVPSLFILTERIARVDFAGLDDAKKHESAEGIRHIFSSLVDYYEKKYASGARYLSDLPYLGQFTYGVKEEGQSPRWFLTDTDPYFDDDKESLFEVMDAFDIEIPTIQEKYAIDLEGEHARVKVLKEKLGRDLEYEYRSDANSLGDES